MRVFGSPLLRLVLCLPLPLAADEWSFGTAQVGGLGGFNRFEGSSGPGIQPSYTLNVALGLSRYLAFTTNYSYNRIWAVKYVECPASGCSKLADESNVLHEFVAGLRTNVSTPSAVTPYFVVVAGLGRGAWAANVRLLGVDRPLAADSVTKPVFGGGGGLDVRIARHVALSIDFRLMKPLQFNWYGRVASGVSLKFN